jgi:type II secretory pathway pseudopilin PulG
MRAHREAGFSLIESVIATALLAAGVAAMAQLLAAAVVTNRTALETTDATLLALQKMEQLRATAFTDLEASPPGALDSNQPGCFEYAGAYVRRWSIAPLIGNPDVLIVQVRVLPLRSAGAGGSGASPGEARLASVRVRAAL